jgi:hypothetical protein
LQSGAIVTVDLQYKPRWPWSSVSLIIENEICDNFTWVSEKTINCTAPWFRFRTSTSTKLKSEMIWPSGTYTEKTEKAMTYSAPRVMGYHLDSPKSGPVRNSTQIYIETRNLDTSWNGIDVIVGGQLCVPGALIVMDMITCTTPMANFSQIARLNIFAGSAMIDSNLSFVYDGPKPLSFSLQNGSPSKVSMLGRPLGIVGGINFGVPRDTNLTWVTLKFGSVERKIPCTVLSDQMCTFFVPVAELTFVKQDIEIKMQANDIEGFALSKAFSYARPEIVSVKCKPSTKNECSRIEVGANLFEPDPTITEIVIDENIPCYNTTFQNNSVFCNLSPPIAVPKIYKVKLVVLGYSSESFDYQLPPVPVANNITISENEVEMITFRTSSGGSSVYYFISSMPSKGRIFQFGSITNPTGPEIIIAGSGNPILLRNDRLIYQPNEDYYGQDSFKYFASFTTEVPDFLVETTGTIFITSKNKAPYVLNATLLNPVIPADDPSNLTLQAFDRESSVLTYFITSVPSIGTLSDRFGNRIRNSSLPYKLSRNPEVSTWVIYQPPYAKFGSRFTSFTWNCRDEDNLNATTPFTVTIDVTVN